MLNKKTDNKGALHCEDWIVSCFPGQATVDPLLEPGWLLGSRQSPYSGCLVIGFNGVIQLISVCWLSRDRNPKRLWLRCLNKMMTVVHTRSLGFTMEFELLAIGGGLDQDRTEGSCG